MIKYFVFLIIITSSFSFSNNYVLEWELADSVESLSYEYEKINQNQNSDGFDYDKKNVELTEGSTIDGASSISYGFSSEKIPISFVEFAHSINIDKNSEFYGVFNYLVVFVNFGLGFKYYTNSKSKSSKFVSYCSHMTFFGDGTGQTNAISISGGYQKKKNINKYFRLGLSSTYTLNGPIGGDKSFSLTPFFSFERRF